MTHQPQVVEQEFALQPSQKADRTDRPFLQPKRLQRDFDDLSAALHRIEQFIRDQIDRAVLL